MRYLVTTTLLIFSLFFIEVSPLPAQTRHPRVINSVKALETPDGLLVTIYETPLLSHVTRRSDDRVQIIIPRAGKSVVAGNVYSGKLAIVQAEHKESDAVFTFDLFPGSGINIKRNTDRLEILVTPPAENTANTTKTGFPPKDSNRETAQSGNNSRSESQTRTVNKTAASSVEVKKDVNAPQEINLRDSSSAKNSANATQSSLRITRVSRRPSLDDFINKSAPYFGTEVTDFRQFSPDDGAPVSRPTRAYLAYDKSSLYVAFVCQEEPGKVRAHMAKREDIFNDDIVSVTLDTFRDRRRAYVFSANPLGVQMDAIITEGQGDDHTFDTLWYSQGRVMADGYAVLIEIPFKSLRFSNSSVQSWGIALGRTIAHKNEEAYFPHITQRKQGYIQQAAALEGLEQISPGRNIQIIPYYVASIERSPDFSRENPGNFRTRADVRAGVDAKVVLKNAFTLDLTVNPDFSQVESDEPQVTINRRFESFFPEKRPFFIENAGFFQTPENLFFSRRIIDPQLGARLTGKTGNWALGGLLIDDQAPGRKNLPGEPGYSRRAVIGVVRVQREFAEQSGVGMLFTNYDFAGSSNRVFSVDSRLRLNENWSFAGQAVRSYARELDGSSVWGSAYLANLSRSSRKFNYDLTYIDRSPDFRATLGFIPRTDIRQIDQSASYKWHPNKRGIVSFGPSGFVLGNWDRTGRLQDWHVSGSFNLDFTGLTGVEVSRSRSYEFFDNQGLHTENNRVFLYSDRLSWLGVFASYNWGSSINYTPAINLDPFVGDSSSGSLELAFRPSTQFSFRQSYIYSHLRTRISDILFDNSRPENIYYNHIFRSKLNYQFTRELSLRAIVDYNAVLPNPTLILLERDKQLTMDFLLTYMLNPGTAVYVGYTDAYENLLIVPGAAPMFLRTRLPFNSMGRRFFIKFNNLIRF